MNWIKRLLTRHATPIRSPPAGRPGNTNAAAGTDAVSISKAANHVAMGNDLLGQGRPAEAAEQYRQAIQADPQHGDAHTNLGFALIEMGQPTEALAPLRRATALVPMSPDAHYLLGTVLQTSLALAPAIEHLERAIALKPDLLVAYRDLGKALHDIGQHDRAKVVLTTGLAVEPRFVDFHYFLGNIELHQMNLTEAMASYRRALEIQPDYASVHSNMAQALLNLCDFDNAVVAARRALALDPTMHFARSNLLMAMSCDPQSSPQEYLAEARQAGEMFMAQASPSGGMPDEALRITITIGSAARPLRIGFVSGDFRNHPVGYFLDSVMSHWDGSLALEAIAYSNHPAADELTARLRGRFSVWRNISGVSDDAVARQIKADHVDILIDLSGHTAENRLPLFARRPAPIQVSWLGYWASTGLPAMDYVLADRVSVPPEHRGQFTESIWYLPDTRLCFTPPSDPDVPEASQPPASQSGHITFGSFQRMTKLNDHVLDLWARVLSAVPDSRLRLQSAQMKDSSARAQLLHRLTVAGIDSARVELAPPGNRLQYFAAHARVDMILDTFPHGGGTTTCEALWMGVPTLTMAGATMLARQGASLLHTAGLADWVATDAADYVARALRHASDLGALVRLRSGLRASVAKSPLFDAPRFTLGFQQALRDMWQRRCA